MGRPVKDPRQLQLENDRLRAERRRDQKTIHDLRKEVQEARSRLDHSLGGVRLVPQEYLEALMALWHVAHYGLPPAGERIPQKPVFESRAPVSDSRAYRRLERELDALRNRENGRAVRIMQYLEQLDQRVGAVERVGQEAA